jgi:hypothetical protein
MPGESTGFVVIGLRVDSTGAWTAPVESLHELARRVGAVELSRVLDAFKEIPSERLVRSVSPGRLLELERKAAGRGTRPARSLTSFWRLDVRRSERGTELVDRLAHVDVVDFAYPEIAGSDPQVNPADDPHAAQQLYVDPAPVGIDAELAWTLPHGSGTSVGFVDVEQGWNLAHEDLPAIIVLPGVPLDMNAANGTSIRHGTGVLGIVVGKDNQAGIVGVAPTPAWVSVASHYRAYDGTWGHVADAIAAVLASGGLAGGDVILIEYQDGLNRPAEMEPPIRAAIQLATALEMIVVEAAGNGNLDLDTYPELNRLNPATFEESGAIIVGGCLAALDASAKGHDRWTLAPPPAPGSNFGSRIDCHAHAEQVVTTGRALSPADALGPGVGPNDEYRRDFGGTSAAAAIVAGAAVVLQGLHKAVRKGPLTPTAMRHALSKYGTPQGTGQPGHIGVMPDLKKAVRALRLKPKKPPKSKRPSAPSNVRIVS